MKIMTRELFTLFASTTNNTEVLENYILLGSNHEVFAIKGQPEDIIEQLNYVTQFLLNIYTNNLEKEGLTFKNFNEWMSFCFYFKILKYGKCYIYCWPNVKVSQHVTSTPEWIEEQLEN